MKIRVPNYFKDFKCIASKCEDTCCAGWGIVIDDEALEKYQKVLSLWDYQLKMLLSQFFLPQCFLQNQVKVALKYFPILQNYFLKIVKYDSGH